MAARSWFRGHPIEWRDERWVYGDDGAPLPATGGEIRPCAACGACHTLGEGEVDPCLGVLPGVDNACCGHGVQSESYVRFTNGVTLKGFSICGMDADPTSLSEQLEQERRETQELCAGLNRVLDEAGIVFETTYEEAFQQLLEQAQQGSR